jgi:benzodiazapine receptor
VIASIPDRWIEIAVAAAAVTAVATLGALLTEIGPWYAGLRVPAWRPPNWAFGPIWGVIFLLVAAGGVLAWERAPDANARIFLIALFALNGALNVFWSGLFFKLRRPDWALAEVVGLWLSILALALAIGSYSISAAAFMLPYLVWVTIASVLNLRIVQMNAPFGGG